MVSGFLTSPRDHNRIWSGEASAILTASKLLTSCMLVLLHQCFLALEVDAERARRLRDVLLDLLELDLLLVLAQDLDIEAEALQLLDEHLEGLGHARLLDVLALDDRLVRLDAPHDVVGLDGEQLLERVRRAVRLERPHLHLPEPLPAELRLAAQGLLRDQRVRPRGPRV